MDHIVYTDAKAGELVMLLSEKKKMVIRGASGRKLPYGRVFPGDTLYFMNNNAEALVKAKGVVSGVIHSERMDESESVRFIENHQEKLQLTPDQLKRWRGKRYIVLIEVSSVVETDPFPIDRTRFGNMDDWLPAGDIEKVKIK